jgi:drug/metabolite transporter (DMT)-like permease
MTLTSRETRVVLGLLGFGVAGGSAFMFVKLLVGEISPVQLVTGRVAMAALPLLAAMWIAGSTPRLSTAFLTGATTLALIDTIAPYLLIAWAQQHVHSSTAALLVSTMPLFTTLIAMRTSESAAVTPTAAGGLVCGFLGVAVLAGPDAFDFTSSSALGMFAVIAAALCYAAGAVYSRSLMRYADPLGLSAVKLAAAVCLLLPATIATDGIGDFAELSLRGWLGLIAVGFISTGIGRCVYQWVIAEAGSVRASLVTYIVPVVALLLGWAVLGESVGAATLAGATLIVTGVAGVMYGAQIVTLVRAMLPAYPAPRSRAATVPVTVVNRGPR